MKHCLSLDVVMPLCTHRTYEVRFNPCKIRFFFKMTNNMFKSDMTPGTQRRRHQKSETGVLVAPQKGLMSSKLKKKRYGAGKCRKHKLSVTK